jgi:glucose-6-phosphate isomerase
MTTHRRFSPLRYDPTDALRKEIGGWEGFYALETDLLPARSRLLDLPWARQPAALLAEVAANRRRSTLGRVLAAAKRLREHNDRVIVLGSGGVVDALAALFAACCHPLHNQLGRGERGGRPRVHLLAHPLDNDLLQAVLDLLPDCPAATADMEAQCGLLLAADDCGSLGEPVGDAAAAELLCRRVRASLGPTARLDAHLVAAGPAGHPAVEALAVEGAEVIASDRSGAIGVAPFAAGSLLAASVMGMDIIKLLEGAAQIVTQFAQQPLGANPALDFAVVLHLWRRAAAAARTVSIEHLWCAWTSGLEAVACWHQHHASLPGRAEAVWRPADVQAVLPSGSTSADGCWAFPPLLTHLAIDRVRRDRLPQPSKRRPEGIVSPEADTTLAGLAQQTLNELRARQRRAGWPNAVLQLPEADEASIGQLMQLLLLSAGLLEQLAPPASTTPGGAIEGGQG